MNYIKTTYGIPSAGIKYQRFQELPPCGGEYWMVMVDADLAPPARQQDSPVATGPDLILACG
ncbi:hypothetical protein [Micromonospora maritima]|uniref:Uncharacterized protein n=1 Tax=Micromonospora maritima TaxID=986711 RepID=A0ABW7ZRI8_9ACTN